MEKIIDSNGRLFGKISIIDVIVLAVVIILAIALNLKNELTPTSTAVSNTPIYFEVLTDAIPDYVAESIKVGDVLFDKDQVTGGSIGVITEVEWLPGARSTVFNDGRVVLAEIEDHSVLRLRVEGSGLVEDGKYNINRLYNIGVNASRNFYSKYALFKIFVTQISTEPLK